MRGSCDFNQYCFSFVDKKLTDSNPLSGIFIQHKFRGFNEIWKLNCLTNEENMRNKLILGKHQPSPNVASYIFNKHLVSSTYFVKNTKYRWMLLNIHSQLRYGEYSQRSHLSKLPLVIPFSERALMTTCDLCLDLYVLSDVYLMTTVPLARMVNNCWKALLYATNDPQF